MNLHLDGYPSIAEYLPSEIQVDKCHPKSLKIQLLKSQACLHELATMQISSTPMLS